MARREHRVSIKAAPLVSGEPSRVVTFDAGILAIGGRSRPMPNDPRVFLEQARQWK